MADSLPTTKGPYTEWGSGTANSSRSGFQQAPAAIPDEGEIWEEYFDNVLRGDQDGPWYGHTGTITLTHSKTFSEASPTGEKPPKIRWDHIDGLGNPGIKGGGFPDGGFVPTVASPGAGNGDNPTTIPVLDGMLVRKLIDAGAGVNSNGSVIAPDEGSTCQTSQDAAQAGKRSPGYEIGTYAWSDLISPRPV